MASRYELLKDAEAEHDVPTERPRRRVPVGRLAIGGLLLAGTFFALTCYPRLPTIHVSFDGSSAPEPSLQGDLRQCPSGLPPPATPPAPHNPWAPLTVAESVSVQEWLSAPARGLNLTRGDRWTLSDNVIYNIELLRPPKDAALAYLTAPDSASAPTRFARVTMHRGGDDEPVIEDHVVGPLPIGKKTTMRPLKDIYHRESIPYNARAYIALAEIVPLLARYMAPLAPITEDLFGASARGLANDTLVGALSGPFSFDGSFRRGWVYWRRNVSGTWLHPINFFQYVDVSGTDPGQWKVLKVVYNHQVFDSVEEFVAAYKNGTLVRLVEPAGTDPRTVDRSWSSRKRPITPEGARDLDHLPGPRSISLAGLRFRVDHDAQYISWMGWGLYLGFDREMGLSLWDVRFKSERIAYEISPQEAIAQYSGNDPYQVTTAWLDRYFGMGASVRDLVPGYDCPHEAVYLPATTFVTTAYITRERAICVFEMDSGRPLTRHTGYEKAEFGAVRGYVLTVRSISTVGNYDYLFDYMFQIDGTIEVRVSASGYLQGGFWEPKQTPYGTPIRESSMGSLHDHVINFKVDLDVAGTANSLVHTFTSREEITQPWFLEDWGSTVIQSRINRKVIDNEDDAKLKYPLNFQGGYALVNLNETNSWGMPRGYGIHPGYSPIHNTIVGSKRLLNNANWARYNLAVSRRKETEPSSSSMWNFNLPGDPTVDFHKFFDGENITQQDLVAWVNIGMHHIPQAEDSPNTRTNLAASSFFLTPVNYFDADVSLESSNAILLDHPPVPGEPFSFDNFGVNDAHCVPAPVPPLVYTGLSAADLDGKEMDAPPPEELRKGAELFHRIKIEL